MLTPPTTCPTAAWSQTVVEMALRSGVGARVEVPDGLDPFVFLLSESTARAVVVVRPDRAGELLELCAEHGTPVTPIGSTGGDALVVAEAYGAPVTLPLAELRAVSDATLPALFG